MATKGKASVGAKAALASTNAVQVQMQAIANANNRLASIPTQANAPANAPANGQVYCKVCGKPIARPGTLAVGQGVRCTHVQKANGHSYYKVVASMPNGVVSVGSMHKLIVANKATMPGLSVAKMVKAFGTDKGLYAPMHPVWQVYVVNGQRYVSAWLATKAGLQALASGNYANVPASAIVKA